MKQILVTFFILLPFYFFPQDDGDKEALMYDYFEKGYEQMYFDGENAYRNLESALGVATEIEDYDSQLGILDHMVMSSSYHYHLKKYKETLDKIESRLIDTDIASKVQDYEGWQISFQSNTGGYYFKTKEYVKAKSIFLDIRSRFDSIRSEDLTASQADYLSSANSYLGTIYKHLGKYELSEQYHLRNIALIRANPELAQEAESLIIGEQRLLAQLYALMGRFDKANTLYEKSLDWGKENYSKDKIFKNHVLSTFQKATQNYIVQDSLKKALFYLDESQRFLIEDDPFYKDALILYGDVYSGLKENQKALESYQNALAYFQDYRRHRPHQDIAEVHGKIAAFHLKKKDYANGLKAMQSALKVSGRKTEIDDLDNPDPTKVFSKKQLLQLLDTKLQLLQMAHSQTNDEQFLKAALQTNKAILGTFDLLKKEFESKLDKQFLAESAYPIFHRMLAVVFEAYKENPSKVIFELALNISEKNKDFLLLEALRNVSATQYGDVPKSIIEKEARLRAEISNSEKNLFDATEKEADFSVELFDLKQEYYGFLDTLETKYPKYHDLKYKSTPIHLDEVGQKLENSEALISYIMAGDDLYVLIFDENDRDFLKINFDEANRESVREFYKLISSPTIKDNSQVISELAMDLYNTVLKSPLANFKNENLTIIPDDVLHYLPFDLLVDENQLLLKSRLIGYGNSISSYLELKEKQNETGGKILAFAPSFDDEIVESEVRLEFGKLLYNTDEVNKIGNTFDTEIYLDANATLENFKAKAPEFNVIHLATHASANDEYPDYSYLAFSKNSEESNILYIKDLYNTVLNADMVTLSACQTGIGKLQKGQGMMSLSKGFFYAGAKSLVNTLWKINDKNSVKLMEFFYEGLSEGLSKKEALRDAKLKYLSSTDDNLLRHPYYWSAFVVSGDTAPIVSSNSWWYYAGGGLFAMAILYFYSSRRRLKIALAS